MPSPLLPTRDNSPRRFRLERDEDVSGVSGTGIVAFGVLFHDGEAVTRWVDVGKGQSTCVWHSMADLEAIHGHDGRTRVVFIDG